MGMMYPFFFLLKKLGLLRITREEELVSCQLLSVCLCVHPMPSHSDSVCLQVQFECAESVCLQMKSECHFGVAPWIDSTVLAKETLC